MAFLLISAVSFSEARRSPFFRFTFRFDLFFGNHKSTDLTFDLAFRIVPTEWNLKFSQQINANTFKVNRRDQMNWDNPRNLGTKT